VQPGENLGKYLGYRPNEMGSVSHNHKSKQGIHMHAYTDKKYKSFWSIIYIIIIKALR